jgi:hypothetical protein
MQAPSNPLPSKDVAALRAYRIKEGLRTQDPAYRERKLFALLPGEPHFEMDAYTAAMMSDDELLEDCARRSWYWKEWASTAPDSWIMYCIVRDSGYVPFEDVNTFLEAWGRETLRDRARWADDGGYTGD